MNKENTMPDDNLVDNEERKILQHQAAKDAVRNEVNAQIGNKVTEANSANQSDVSAVADNLRQRTVAEIGSRETSLERASSAARISQIIDYVFYLIYGVITLEIVLDVIGASNTNGFKSFLNSITAPLLMPFNKLMPNPSVGHFTLMISYIVALVVYVLLHLAINGLLRMFVHKKTSV